PRRPPTLTLFPYTPLFRSAKSPPAGSKSATTTSEGQIPPSAFTVVVTPGEPLAETKAISTGSPLFLSGFLVGPGVVAAAIVGVRSEEHTSELQSRENLVCR